MSIRPGGCPDAALDGRRRTSTGPAGRSADHRVGSVAIRRPAPAGRRLLLRHQRHQRAPRPGGRRAGAEAAPADLAESAGDAAGAAWLLSAQAEAALPQAARRLARHLRACPASPGRVAAALAWDRTAFRHRAAVWGTGLSELLAALDALADGQPHERAHAATAPAEPISGRCCSTGQGSQYPGMARALYQFAAFAGPSRTPAISSATWPVSRCGSRCWPQVPIASTGSARPGWPSPPCSPSRWPPRACCGNSGRYPTSCSATRSGTAAAHVRRRAVPAGRVRAGRRPRPHHAVRPAGRHHACRGGDARGGQPARAPAMAASASPPSTGGDRACCPATRT